MPATKRKPLFAVPEPDRRPLLTPAQVAERLGITIDAVRKKAQRGLLPFIRIDERNMRFHEADIDEFIASRRRE